MSQKDKKNEAVSESDKKHLFQLLVEIQKKFGTEDLEWFCSAEAILNTLFNIKTRNAPEYAKYFINVLVEGMYTKPSL